MAPLKAVHIIGSRLSGGAERFFIRLVRGMVSAGVETSIIVRNGSHVGREMAGEVTQFTVPMINVRDPWSRIRITRILRSLSPQVVQTYMGRATRLTRVPKGIRAVHVARLGGFYKLVGYRHADAWVGNTREVSDYLLENGFPPERVFYIGNFVDPEPPVSEETLASIRLDLGIPEDAIVVVSAGRFVRKKGFDLLLEGFSRVPRGSAGRPVHLVLVGSGDREQELKALSLRLGIQDRVHWPGWQDQPGPYYELSDLFVCPSHHEPLGNVILEAWNHGVPVLSTATQGARELIEDGVSGMLVPCGDARSLGLGIERLLAHPDESRHLAVEGAKRLEACYRRETVVEEYLRMYRQLLESS